MGTEIQARRTIPAPTPQLTRSLSPDALVAHRQAIAFDVEVILDGYWDRMPPADVKAGILADWADALEDWTQEQVLYGLRKWRNENPSKKPNPGHILVILKGLRGIKEAQRAALSKQAADATPDDDMTPVEREASRKRIAEMCAEVAGAKRMGPLVGVAK